MIGPDRIWWYSSHLYHRGYRLLGKLLSRANYWLYHADLPAECTVQKDIQLFHRGIGVVVNPSVELGRGVRIVHGVTIGCATAEGRTPGRVVVGNNVRIGANATIIAPAGKTVVIGDDAQIGAHAYVRSSVKPRGVVLAPVGVERD